MNACSWLCSTFALLLSKACEKSTGGGVSLYTNFDTSFAAGSPPYTSVNTETEQRILSL